MQQSLQKHALDIGTNSISNNIVMISSAWGLNEVNADSAAVALGLAIKGMAFVRQAHLCVMCFGPPRARTGPSTSCAVTALTWMLKA